MNKSRSVTLREQKFPPSEKLISATNLEGVITHCNDAFEKISGYSRDELIGQHHNIVRHPDMPKEAFEVMWQHLQAGRPWMGMVKNRCKNGDHYWVSAYVTPVTENSQVVGYESVRSYPAQADIERAEKLYARMNQKRRQLRVPVYLKQLMVAVAFIIPALILGYSVSPLASSLWLIVSLLTFGGLQYLQYRHDLQLITNELQGVFMHPLATSTYTNQHGMTGNVMVGVMSLRAHLDAVLTRIEDASRQVKEQSHRGLALTETAREEIVNQSKQTGLVATAMHEMSLAIHEISENVQKTAGQADHSSSLANQGVEIAYVTRTSIEQLRSTVLDIGQAVKQLADQTDSIAKAAASIETISDQTNLLALNAAIEAARAGEHGRGFSVVADEVRLLASNTRDSAKNIGEIVSGLSKQATASVLVAEEGAADAELGLQRVVESESMLLGIVEAVSQITAMSEQMATAVEEQAMVSQEVNNQVAEISALAERSLHRTDESAESIRSSQRVSEQLYELVNRFKS
ncbi:MAG TPA: methyl-accepting chemotaxis protein [Thiopseudomonas sp.]|nr:methyl-accepting chemotaxis protein [Thiopseudomonas sp.]